MKIVLIHYRYYSASGPERYLFNFKKLFEIRGHEIYPFSINYNQNKAALTSNYFVDSVLDDGNFHIKENTNISTKNKLQIIKNLFYNKQAYNNLNQLLIDKKPDLIYLLQYYGKLSPSILKAAKKIIFQLFTGLVILIYFVIKTYFIIMEKYAQNVLSMTLQVL
jgi:hypothetical protein